MNQLRLFSLILLATLLVGDAIAEIDVRVGIVAYDDFDDRLDDYERLFRETIPSDESIRFRIAPGSYGDVLHWLDQGLVDVAILTPGAFASLMPSNASAASEASEVFTYLATIQVPPASSPFATTERKASGFHSSYTSVALVNHESSIHSFEDLRQAARSSEAEFLFVHPMSVSGCMIPIEALHQAGINPTEDQFRYTYSHSQSIRLLHESESGKERIAFVWDDATASEPELESTIRRINFPDLDQIRIPQNVIVARSDYPHVDRVKQRLADAAGDQNPLIYLDDWRVRFESLRARLTAAKSRESISDSSRVSVNELAQSFLHDSRSQSRPTRLALVMSGGGAKCSYQVGAVAALEQELANLRQRTGEHGLDISLVVGTSGGAINSVPVALGITNTEDGYQAFRNTWRSLDQREIVRPSWLIRANMGLWFTALQIALITWACRKWIADRLTTRKRMARLVILLAAIEIGLGYAPFEPWQFLGTNHLLHHLWLWLSFGLKASAVMMLAIGLSMLVIDAIKSDKANFDSLQSEETQRVSIPSWATKTTLVACILGLPLIQGITIFFYQQTLSTGSGMEYSLAQRFPELIDQHLAQQQLPTLNLNNHATHADRLRQTSRQIKERGLLARDLVITGSCLKQTSDELPSDLYFFLSADHDSDQPNFGERGVSLADRSESLLDVVMGSGSIYPVFPSRAIDGVPRQGESIDLIDGGFAHNSPIEAAVLWGATHIVLIEASPRKRSTGGNFLNNAASAFQHLYRQAQLVDTRSRGRVKIYSLAPQRPHICVLDFAENLVDDSIQRGFRDVANGERTFQREFGEPVFTN